MNKILVIAPHPDDETLGCGGTLLKHFKQGDKTNWLICTEAHIELGWTQEEIKLRESEIDVVSEKYCFNSVKNLKIPAAKVDTFPMSKLINKIGDFVKILAPDIVYLPNLYDAHSDHYFIAKASHSMIKWFRYPSIKKVLVYETISETNFNFSSKADFQPNVFNNISDYIDEKINIMKIYNSEFKDHPFPRSEQAIRSLAILRGSQSGYSFAEAFTLIYERQS